MKKARVFSADPTKPGITPAEEAQLEALQEELQEVLHGQPMWAAVSALTNLLRAGLRHLKQTSTPDQWAANKFMFSQVLQAIMEDELGERVEVGAGSTRH